MSKYNLDFVGLNTFIYEPVGFGDEDEFIVGILGTPAIFAGYESLSYVDHKLYPGISTMDRLKAIAIGYANMAPETLNVIGTQPFDSGFNLSSFITNFNVPPPETYKNYNFPYHLPTTASFFTALMIHRNGPYGWPAFNSTRLGQNPLSRRQRKSNLLTVLGERKRITNNNDQIITARNGQITLFNEPCVATNSPLTFRLARDLGVGAQYYRNFRNRRGRPLVSRPLPIAVKVSFDNEVNMFSNTELDNILGIEQKERSERYESLSNMYLRGALDLPISAITRFKSLTFSQGLFPREKYSFKSYTRARPSFDFSWRHKQEDRNTKTPRLVLSDYFNKIHSSTAFSSSLWLLDVPDEWKNWPAAGSEAFVQRLGFTRPDNRAGAGGGKKQDQCSASYGLLWNTFSQAAVQLNGSKNYYGDAFTNDFTNGSNDGLQPGALYARRHSLRASASVTNQSGMPNILDTVKTDLIGSNYDFLFSGEAAWDTPISASAFPFYNSYSDYCEDIKRIGKDYSIIPEFKISNFVEYYQTNDVQDPISNFLEVSGGHTSFNDSTTDKFFEIYSTTEFLKNFDVVLKDHKNFVEPSHLKITCNIISKFIPYDGFYPVQRTHQIAKQFFKSYKSNIFGITGSVDYDAGTGRTSVPKYPHAADLVMRPLFGPGVLFNSIKSGVACDYPILTSSVKIVNQAGNYLISNKKFHERVPFEALVEPQQFIADIPLCNMEPHPSSSYKGTGSWDGKGDDLYAKMTSNFLAEVPEFFLRGRNFTTIASVPSSDPNFGRAIAGKTYGMRVKMYRSMTGSAVQITSSTGRGYTVPQDIIDRKRKETITMYSRPSAFGPPSLGRSEFELTNDIGVGGSDFSSSVQNFEKDGFTVTREAASDLQKISKDSRHGFNFPFTPPYYHGQAWADIIFKPTTTKKYTVQEIIDQSEVRYYRYWTGSYSDYALNNTNMPGRQITDTGYFGPQAFERLNDNAMQLSGSVNLFGIATLGDFNQNPVSDPSEPARWTIQTKFETPILNFNEYEDKTKITLCNNPASSSIPRGMWHQFGRVPRINEGIFLQVDKIPFSWQFGALKATPQNATASLADLCGFSNRPQKLGLMPRVTVLREAVVAIPFLDRPEGRKFFSINRGRNDPKGKFAIDIAIKRIAGINPNILESHYGEVSDELIDITRKMQDFVMPPQMDFVNFPDDVDPFVLYIFDFERRVARKGLSHIWQGVLPPRLGVEHRKQSASVQHSLLTSELLKQKDLKEQTLKWLVFKIKKRAKINYFDKVYTQANGIPKKVVRGQYAQSETFDFIGGKEAKDKISYNWPYDFFSIIELVKIKADVKFADFDIETGLEKEIVSKDLSAINDPTLSSIDD